MWKPYSESVSGNIHLVQSSTDLEANRCHKGTLPLKYGENNESGTISFEKSNSENCSQSIYKRKINQNVA